MGEHTTGDRRPSERAAGLALAGLLVAGMLIRPQPSPAGAPPANDPGTPFAAATGVKDPVTGIRVPKGFQATVFADKLGRTRHIVLRADGTVYASLARPVKGGGIVALKDTDGDGKADVIRYFGAVAGTGIAIHDGHLYFGEDRRIVRAPLAAGRIDPVGPFETMISGFPDQGQHATKPMAFDDAGNMYVTVGAPSNACQERMRTAGSPGMRPCPQLALQAGIWRFAADRPGQVHGRDGTRYATGIRNALAIAWNRTAGALYFVTHGRDQLYSLWPQFYTPEKSAALPAEEFHRVHAGGDYGWPYTYWDQIRDQRMRAPEYGGDGKTPADNDRYEKPLYGFPGHWAPMALVFYEHDAFPAFFRHGAFVVFHGSWNRAPLPQEGYLVAFVPMDEKGAITGRPIVFADGFKGREPLHSPRRAAFRPSGIAVGPDGALYVCEDKTGRIWRITYGGGSEGS